MGDGRFLLNRDTVISAEGPGAISVAELLASHWRPATGFPLPVVSGAGRSAPIHLACLLKNDIAAGDPEFPDESYRLQISARAVRLTAEHAAGLARGIQTVRQLMPASSFSAAPPDSEWFLPALVIEDCPRFCWRGMHLDVARHFFSVEEVCRFIDLIALHRFNRLHLHLTDDQGWRIEIKKYPRLAEVGAWRPCTVIGSHSVRPRRYDDQPHGGFYSHEDIRRIVDFATRRHITVVPEIEMPGHVQAAIAAYPELGNGNRPREPLCHWGISNEILNMEADTLAFVRDVLSEVMTLFPGRYVHIGGDEVPKYEWENSRRIQAQMLELGVRDEQELQGWFIGQIGRFLAEHDRQLIGWDEIADSGLPPGAAVTCWRDEVNALAIARQEHEVVMAPCQFLYFDFYQADPIHEEPLANGREITVGRVYAYEPIPGGLEQEKHRWILGAQGQLWSEYIASAEHLDYMAFPRVCALAEVLWLPRERKNFRQFLRRLGAHRNRLRALSVNVHPLP